MYSFFLIEGNKGVYRIDFTLSEFIVGELVFESSEVVSFGHNFQGFVVTTNNRMYDFLYGDTYGSVVLNSIQPINPYTGMFYTRDVQIMVSPLTQTILKPNVVANVT